MHSADWGPFRSRHTMQNCMQHCTQHCTQLQGCTKCPPQKGCAQHHMQHFQNRIIEYQGWKHNATLLHAILHALLHKMLHHVSQPFLGELNSCGKHKQIIVRRLANGNNKPSTMIFPIFPGLQRLLIVSKASCIILLSSQHYLQCRKSVQIKR